MIEFNAGDKVRVTDLTDGSNWGDVKVGDIITILESCRLPYFSFNGEKQFEEGTYYIFDGKGEVVTEETQPEQSQENGNSIGGGKRYNKGKASVELLVPEAMEETAKVWGYGAAKYTPNNWRNGLAITSILGCILRHTFAIMRGEDVDPETGFMHAGHIICNCQMLIYFYKTDQYKKLDDRYKRGPSE